LQHLASKSEESAVHLVREGEQPVLEATGIQEPFMNCETVNDVRRKFAEDPLLGEWWGPADPRHDDVRDEPSGEGGRELLVQSVPGNVVDGQAEARALLQEA